ncbi:DNA-binding response regulator [Streptomyces beijiangensis]
MRSTGTVVFDRRHGEILRARRPACAELAPCCHAAADGKMARTMSTDRIVTLRGDQELVARAGDLIAGARQEFLVAATDPWTFSPGVNAAFARGKRPHMAPGMVMRKLYTPRAVADAESVRRLLKIAATGPEVRIAAAPLTHEAIVLDGRTAILAGAPESGVRTYTVVRTPEVVASIRSLIAATWETADGLAAFSGRPRPDLTEESRRILRTLGAGHTDETASRHLGMSLRTYRRRVAELMETLDATSRFQAGVRARDLGVGG